MIINTKDHCDENFDEFTNSLAKLGMSSEIYDGCEYYVFGCFGHRCARATTNRFLYSKDKIKKSSNNNLLNDIPDDVI